MSESKHLKSFDPIFAAKYAAAQQACALVEDGMVIGLGSGSTAEIFIELLAARKLSIQCVATSDKSAAIAQTRGLQLLDHFAWRHIDLTIDGADEIDGRLNLIKGLGAALVREKIIARFSKRLVILADQSKCVPQLGTRAPLPVEVSAIGREAARYHLAALLGDIDDVRLRCDKSGKVIATDGGGYIYDCFLGAIKAPLELAAQLDALPFVIGHGLFLGMVEQALIGQPDGEVEARTPPA